MTYADRSVLILGAARQGKALVRYLVAAGARVTLSDSAPADKIELGDLPALGPAFAVAFGGHPLSLLDGCELLCLSGGVPIDLPIVNEARARGIPLSNDAQIFAEQCPAPIIAITGSAGKTTTTTLTGEMLKAQVLGSKRRVWVGGNIGNPLISDLGRIHADDPVVMELSSFQLEQMMRSPQIACVTNVTPNHLDRHGTMDAYVAAKRRIVQFQHAEDLQILNADDAVTRTFNTQARTVWFSLKEEPHGDGAWLDETGMLRLRVGALQGRPAIDDAVCHRRELKLMGAHNIANVLAASAVSACAGASLDAIRGTAIAFTGVAHRLQLVAERNGVRYYDDSIATAPERMMAALRCFEQKVILLCGGRDKHLPWDEAAALMYERCKAVLLFGEMGPMVAEHVSAVTKAAGSGLHVETCAALEDAVTRASTLAIHGDIVLLSPGGTSYDAFKDFAERGDRFSALAAAA